MLLKSRLECEAKCFLINTNYKLLTLPFLFTDSNLFYPGYFFRQKNMKFPEMFHIQAFSHIFKLISFSQKRFQSKSHVSILLKCSPWQKNVVLFNEIIKITANFPVISLRRERRKGCLTEKTNRYFNLKYTKSEILEKTGNAIWARIKFHQNIR